LLDCCHSPLPPVCRTPLEALEGELGPLPTGLHGWKLWRLDPMCEPLQDCCRCSAQQLRQTSSMVPGCGLLGCGLHGHCCSSCLLCSVGSFCRWPSVPSCSPKQGSGDSMLLLRGLLPSSSDSCTSLSALSPARLSALLGRCSRLLPGPRQLPHQLASFGFVLAPVGLSAGGSGAVPLVAVLGDGCVSVLVWS
jgi:hypothetical protein